MPKRRSKPLAKDQDRAGSSPVQAEVERAIEHILDRLKPKAPKPDVKIAPVVTL